MDLHINIRNTYRVNENAFDYYTINNIKIQTQFIREEKEPSKLNTNARTLVFIKVKKKKINFPYFLNYIISI